VTEECACRVCLRQSPSPKSTASHTVFEFLYNLEIFKLSCNTTCAQYVYAVNSKILAVGQIVPNTFPKIVSNYRYCREDPTLKFHYNCSPPGNPYACYGSREETFQFEDDAFESFIEEKNIWWCSHCDKPWFISQPCIRSRHWTIEPYSCLM
jgi:hypothetical protein